MQVSGGTCELNYCFDYGEPLKQFRQHGMEVSWFIPLATLFPTRFQLLIFTCTKKASVIICNIFFPDIIHFMTSRLRRSEIIQFSLMSVRIVETDSTPFLVTQRNHLPKDRIADDHVVKEGKQLM